MADSGSTVADLQHALHLHQQGEIAAAKSAYQDVLLSDPNNADALHLLGMLHLECGDLDSAEALLRSAITQSPRNGVLLNSLGVCLMRQERHADAQLVLEESLNCGGADNDATENLGEVFAKIDRLEDAIGCWERLLVDAPERTVARRSLVAALQKQGKFQEAGSHLFALVCQDAAKERDVLALANLLKNGSSAESVLRECRRRLTLNPDHVALNQLVGCVLASRLSPSRAAKLTLPQQQALTESAIEHLERSARLRPTYLSYDLVGRNLMEVHRPQEATAWLKRALDSNPDFAPAHECFGAASLSLGDSEAATQAFIDALRLYPRSPLANYELARLGQSPPKPTIEDLEAELASGSLSKDDQILLHSALGHRYKPTSDYRAAWNHFCQSGILKTNNETRSADEIFDSGPIIADFHGKSESPLATDFPPNPVRMIFIVGMPRSGTTLVEQILSSHDQIAGCGELTYLSSLAGGVSHRFAISDSFPESLSKLSREQIMELRSEYLDQVDQQLSCDSSDRSSRFAIDKMPTNFRFLGLICRLFPEAKILHVHRDPRDVAVSCLEQNLAWPFCLPKDLATYIKHYQLIMREAANCLGDNLFTLQYADLVESPKEQVSSVLDFLGLPWQDDCLRFHRSKRAVSTPSKHQVRQPIHSSSIGKWKRFYDCDPSYFGSLSESKSSDPNHQKQ